MSQLVPIFVPGDGGWGVWFVDNLTVELQTTALANQLCRQALENGRRNWNKTDIVLNIVCIVKQNVCSLNRLANVLLSLNRINFYFKPNDKQTGW